MGMSAAGKGDDYRPVDRNKYDMTLNRIFGKKCPLCGSSTSHINNKIMCDNNNCNFEEEITNSIKT